MSIDEAQKYFSSQSERKGYATPYAKKQGAYISEKNGGSSWWWLRTPGYDNYDVMRVFCSGDVHLNGDGVHPRYVTVRPALWLNL